MAQYHRDIDASRFFDTSSFLNDVSYHDESHLVQFKTRMVPLAQKVMKECIQNTGPEPSKITRSNASRGYSTLYHGALGPHAFLPLKWVNTVLPSKNQQQKQKLLLQAKNSAVAALDDCSRSQRRFVVTLLEGTWVGAKCMLIAAENGLGYRDEAARHAMDLVRVLEGECRSDNLPPPQCEVLYGRAGAIQAILFVRSELQDRSLGKSLVVKLARDILEQGRKEAQVYNSSTSTKKMPLIWQWHDSYYLGAAHGVVGILHTLLQLSPEDLALVEKDFFKSTGQKIQPLQVILDTVDAILDHFIMPSGNLQSSVHKERDRLVQWCHGGPGLCLLLLRASTIYQDFSPKSALRYLEVASSIAENVVWPRGLLAKGTGLCHGISGNGYVLLQLSQAFESKQIDCKTAAIWRKRAIQFAKFAVDHLNELRDIPDSPFSIYEGMSGLVCFLVDCSSVSENKSSFPLYDFI
jgi:hypothetical protein